ncbi:MAG: aminopeptidase P N-terminal domain-containing protein [Bacteroidota bacterium]|nr:aminopeptidase P N-terminal domain-containing protein [Bacteroidota bacterium]
MRYKSPNKEFFIKNRAKLVNFLPKNSVVVINSNDEMPRNGDQNFPFRQNSDLFYLTGLDQEKCILLLCPDHPEESKREIVFTIEADENMVIWNGHRYAKEEVAEICGVENVQWTGAFESFLRDLVLQSEHVFLNQIEYPKYQTEVPYKDLRFANEIKVKFPENSIKRVAPLLAKLRGVKEPEELEMMQKAADITNKAFYKVLKTTRPGVMEYEVEAEMTYEFLHNGAAGHAYPPIIASGESACILHYIDNDKVCNDGDLMLMDFGAEYGNYAADVSRTIPVNGKFTPRQSECYNAVLRVMKKAIKLYVPGNTINKVDKIVKKMMEAEMVSLGLFTEEDVKNQNSDSPMYFRYFMHGMNHYLGLDVHDVGAKDTEFVEGMVLTCEPGLYIAEEKIGIRIENDIVVGEEPFDLTRNIPREIDEIEKIMQERK